MKGLAVRVAGLLSVLLVASCSRGNEAAYTLYRSAFAGDAVRLHIATFDADDSRDYNRQNCEIARDLFQSQPGVSVRYWCELGRFRR